MDLSEFLLARIAEDEAAARGAVGYVAEFLHKWSTEVTDYLADRGPARVLAECEAKRRIVDHFVHLMQPGEPDISPEYDDGYIDATEFALKLLALPFADHPAYREEWRP